MADGALVTEWFLKFKPHWNVEGTKQRGIVTIIGSISKLRLPSLPT